MAGSSGDDPASDFRAEIGRAVAASLAVAIAASSGGAGGMPEQDHRRYECECKDAPYQVED
jgi:hypothetical protein